MVYPLYELYALYWARQLGSSHLLGILYFTDTVRTAETVGSSRLKRSAGRSALCPTERSALRQHSKLAT